MKPVSPGRGNFAVREAPPVAWSELVSPTGRRHAVTRKTDYLIAALMSAVTVWTVWAGVLHMRADLQSLQARYRIDRWLAGEVRWDIPQWLLAYESLQAALGAEPGNASLHDYMGALYVLRGRQAWASVPLRQAYYRQARNHQLRSVALRPTQGSAWAGLAQSEYALDACSEEQWQAWRKSRHFAPFEAGVTRALAELGVACSASLPADVQAWLTEYRAGARNRALQELRAVERRHGIPGTDAPAAGAMSMPRLPTLQAPNNANTAGTSPGRP